MKTWNVYTRANGKLAKWEVQAETPQAAREMVWVELAMLQFIGAWKKAAILVEIK